MKHLKTYKLFESVVHGDKEMVEDFLRDFSDGDIFITSSFIKS